MLGFLAVIIGFIVIIIIIYYVKEYIVKKYVLNNYGLSKMETGYELTKEYFLVEPGQEINERIYQDLELDTFFTIVDKTYTGIGMEYLYHSLFATKNEMLSQEHIIHNFKDPKIKEELLYGLYQLGKLYSPILNIKQYMKAIPKYYKFLPSIIITISLLIIASCFINVYNLGILALYVSIIYFAHVKISEKSDFLYEKILVLCKMTRLSRKILSLGVLDETSATSLKEAVQYMNKELRISRTLSSVGILDMLYLSELINDLLYLDIVQVIKLIKHKEEIYPHIVTMYKTIGLIDQSISIALLRDSYDTCIPVKQDKKEIQVVGGYHPLLKNPVPNSITLCKNVMITGSNASGKSTFIKMLGINMVLAKAINTCFAKEFYYYPFKVISSIHIRDDMLQGDSYYVKEIRVLKEITDMVEKQESLVLIDEILKGTNEKERLLIAKAILQYLFSKQGISMITTHDLNLLEGVSNVDFYCFNDIKDGEEMKYTYTIEPGVCRVGNAIHVFKSLHFNSELVSKIPDELKEEYE